MSRKLGIVNDEMGPEINRPTHQYLAFDDQAYLLFRTEGQVTGLELVFW